MPFVKLDCGILDSSLWVEPSDTRICWITMLAMADSTGFVAATAPGIARKACISIDACRVALKIFESPDPDSRTQGDEGKRTQREDGGYQIVNYEKYREKDYTNAERQARHRAKRNGVTPVTQGPHGNDRNGVTSLPVTQAEAEAEVKNPAASSPKEGFSLSPPTNHEQEMGDVIENEIFPYYLEKCDRHATAYELTDRRKKTGVSRLRDALRIAGGDMDKAKELMKCAIDAIAENTFNMGQNERKKKYCDWIDHIFKSTERFQDLIG